MYRQPSYHNVNNEESVQCFDLFNPKDLLDEGPKFLAFPWRNAARRRSVILVQVIINGLWMLFMDFHPIYIERRPRVHIIEPQRTSTRRVNT